MASEFSGRRARQRVIAGTRTSEQILSEDDRPCWREPLEDVLAAARRQTQLAIVGTALRHARRTAQDRRHRAGKTRGGYAWGVGAALRASRDARCGGAFACPPGAVDRRTRGAACLARIGRLSEWQARCRTVAQGHRASAALVRGAATTRRRFACNAR